MFSLEETLEKVCDLGIRKVNKTFRAQMILGFIGGAMISFGFLAFIKLYGMIGGGLGYFMGALVFPVGLIIILLAGGELITGNMMVVSVAYWNKKVSGKEMIRNWLNITLANAVGAIFVAYFFGYYLDTLAPYQDLVIAMAQHKVGSDPLRILISGLGCNWFVGLAVWLSVSLKDCIGKIAGIWFPVAVFVILGLQHCVANMFLLSLGVFHHQILVKELVVNLFFSYTGNIIGGGIFVGLAYTLTQSNRIMRV